MKIWTPRFYQTEAVDAFVDELHADEAANLLIGMPTGSGKSGVIAMIIKRLLTQYPGMRATVGTHSKELVAQDAAALIKVWPQAPFGIFSEGLKSKNALMPITFCSILSAVKNIKAFGKQNLFLIDEVQMLSPDEETSYQKFIKGLREENPGLRVGGLSATLYRKKGGMIVEGNIFNKTCYDITGRRAFETLINLGYLIPLKSKPTSFVFDVSKARSVGGDFNQGDIQKIVNEDGKTERALQEALQLGADLNHWMVFCSGIEHVEKTAAILAAWGESVTYIHSKMSDGERDIRIKMFTEGQVRIIVNDGILTTGFDCPFVDHLVVLRPTKSVVLHVQILGRGTRPYYADGFDLETTEGRLAAIAASSKQFCRVSDFGGNLERLGPINDPTLPGRKKKSGIMPIKICQTSRLVYGEPRGTLRGCGEYNFCAARYCEECKAEFIFDEEPKIDKEATKAVAISMSEPECYWFPVDSCEYEPYTRPFQHPAMRVLYYCGLNRYTELISLESEAPYARHRAHEWWRERGFEPPLLTHDGFKYTHDLPIPKWIYVHINTKFPRIMATSFDDEQPEVNPVKAPSHVKNAK